MSIKKTSPKSNRTSKSTKSARAKATDQKKSLRIEKPAERGSETTPSKPHTPVSPATKTSGVANTTPFSSLLARTTANFANLRKQLQPATGKGAEKSAAIHNEELDEALKSLEAGYRRLLRVD